MIIKGLLVAGVLLLLIWFIRSSGQVKISATKKIGLCIFFGIAILSILNPELTNRVANTFGIGRGADLLLYILTLTFIAFVLSQHLRGKEESRRATKIVRKIAIMEANDFKKNK